jgi:hypothetical protein
VKEVETAPYSVTCYHVSLLLSIPKQANLAVAFRYGATILCEALELEESSGDVLCDLDGLLIAYEDGSVTFFLVETKMTIDVSLRCCM